ncbi:hypothetical protein HYH03_019166 [Edaphochlamys debaryana]|uniref:Uncharacterized protein n=1 Tax=Edaphochlamys debaryana TaxID=47281 RepID=A0A836BNR3_9CHLO|nr:hypothetical protein HYH03_019166 [Edaphochlamys debaryana]|eukprot:KAG2481873.1 hypothetical protein HYH03_019166 [Edaphochlamys debaryana]
MSALIMLTHARSVCRTVHAAACSERDPAGCYKSSYSRGAGTTPATCPSGTEQSGLLCYPLCQSGYTGGISVCWQNCPSGFPDAGTTCTKPGSYGRGAGYFSLSQCQADNSQVLRAVCPAGMADIGSSCVKQSYSRGAGAGGDELPLGPAAGWGSVLPQVHHPATDGAGCVGR